MKKLKRSDKPYINKTKLKKKIKNSQIFTNVRSVDEAGLLKLKDGKFANVFEVNAIDVSLSSNQEKRNFFNSLKFLYQVSGVTLKFYKIDNNINLNINKENYIKEIENCEDNNKQKLLNEKLELINELENNNCTLSSNYYLVVIGNTEEILNKKNNEINSIIQSFITIFSLKKITNRLEIYKFLSSLYYSDVNLDELMWCDLTDILSPIRLKEKVDMLKADDKEIQLISIKNISPFIDEMFFEDIFNYPGVSACISINDTLSQDELIRWINNQYQFLLSDRNTTRKLSDATELDTQKENYQILMDDIKNGDEKIKEVSLILTICGNKEYRENIFNELKMIARNYQLKIDIPRFRQFETWQVYDITTKSLKDFSVYLPTLTLSASFPFTKTYFNDNTGYVLGVDLHTSLPIIFDPFVNNEYRTSHNIAVVASTGGGKSFTLKKMIVNEIARGNKIFIFDAEGEYKKLVNRNNGEYIDLYSTTGGIINPLQVRYLPSDQENSVEIIENINYNSCPLAKHLGYLETFLKCSFEDIKESELVVMIDMIEQLYRRFGITQKSEISTLEKLNNKDYPIFDDLIDFLPEYKKMQTNPVKKEIIDKLEILLDRYKVGIDKMLFNNYTSVDLNNDLIAFNIKDLLYSKNKRVITTQLINLLSYLNNIVVSNQINNEKKKESNFIKHLSIIVDEMHLYLRNADSDVMLAFEQLARRVRKYYGNFIPATQSIHDFLGESESIKSATAIFNNSQYQMVGMLKEEDLLAYINLFKSNPLTDTQKNFLSSAQRGEFLFNIDNKNRLRMMVIATDLEKEMMGENIILKEQQVKNEQ